MARFATPEVFYDAAMRLLAGPGLPALRIRRLCSEVGVTSGSFYHHFGSWEGFVEALLAHWSGDQLDRLVAEVRLEPDPRARVEVLRRLALEAPHRAEIAIRGWAASDAAVAAAQNRVDRRRVDALREVFAPLVGDERTALTLAEVGVSLLIGYQQRLGAGDAPVPLSDQLEQYARLVRLHTDAHLGA